VPPCPRPRATSATTADGRARGRSGCYLPALAVGGCRAARSGNRRLSRVLHESPGRDDTTLLVRKGRQPGLGDGGNLRAPVYFPSLLHIVVQVVEIRGQVSGQDRLLRRVAQVRVQVLLQSVHDLWIQGGILLIH